ncbi:GtrA family protein [Endozoicomonas sp. SCSIO W0465]|uniref:GtrA family protein n=1 Tax=Endozoicomonas sp. SCSIO W0465 TaxID=2918516 RepID=UPI0020763343|nr:GtrA family protein [Endozoicomonas sp. SCSIO W0465]USE34513.1 GtrA family protein [Endozoicomonas sp. SCSIO W0465]
MRQLRLLWKWGKARSGLVKFACVGALGFLFDLLVFIAGLRVFHLNAMEARGLAFLVAATVTWVGNRTFTFDDCSFDGYSRGNWLCQWGRHMASACLSAIPNLLAFQLVLVLAGTGWLMVYVALFVGMLAGTLSNYCLSSHWVFSH